LALGTTARIPLTDLNSTVPADSPKRSGNDPARSGDHLKSSPATDFSGELALFDPEAEITSWGTAQPLARFDFHGSLPQFQTGSDFAVIFGAQAGPRKLLL